MTSVEVFDPALCCDSGVCGADVDQDLVTFSAEFGYATKQGATIQRYNLAQQPIEFATNPVVAGFLQRSGPQSLPLTLVDGQIALAGRYPRRAEIAGWCGLTEPAALPLLATGCCGGGGSC